MKLIHIQSEKLRNGQVLTKNTIVFVRFVLLTKRASTNVARKCSGYRFLGERGRIGIRFFPRKKGIKHSFQMHLLMSTIYSCTSLNVIQNWRLIHKSTLFQVYRGLLEHTSDKRINSHGFIYLMIIIQI
jgi:hypothetical protein